MKYFNQKVTILSNCSSQGLMHSFVRHHNQWINFIPNLNTFFNRFPNEVIDVLKEIQQISGRLNQRKYLKKLYNLLEEVINKSTNPSGKRFYVHFSDL